MLFVWKQIALKVELCLQAVCFIQIDIILAQYVVNKAII